MGGPAASIPRVAPISAEWTQAEGCALVRGRGERAQSDSAAMSAMMAVLRLYQAKQETFTNVVGSLHQVCGKLEFERNQATDIANYRLQKWGIEVRARVHNES